MRRREHTDGGLIEKQEKVEERMGGVRSKVNPSKDLKNKVQTTEMHGVGVKEAGGIDKDMFSNTTV